MISTKFHPAALCLCLLVALPLGCSDSSGSGQLECVEPPPPASPPETPFTATEASLAEHEIPQWYDDAKFGIMIHWGLYSVPAWAETTLSYADWTNDAQLEAPDLGATWWRQNGYAEWYQNTIVIDDSGAQQHHEETYGSDFEYADFQAMFEEQSAAFDASTWAQLFSEAGARYVVLVTKHHDGYTLWPSEVENPVRSDYYSPRDLVGELTDAVRCAGMRMGLYYSGGLDWSIFHKPITNIFDFAGAMPPGPEYAAYADAQWRELIERYQPHVLWNDIDYPRAANPLQLFADYYNEIPDGVVNDRWELLRGGHQDVFTPEYELAEDISPRFETIRGVGDSFGYNQNEGELDYLSLEELIFSVVDTTSKNGNFLLNVGPRADGSIPEEQVERLRGIGQWLDTNGRAIYGTRPWERATATTTDDLEVRFTQNPQEGTLYVIVIGDLEGSSSVVVEDLDASDVRGVELLGHDGALTWSQEGADVRIELPSSVRAQPAHAFALTRTP